MTFFRNIDHSQTYNKCTVTLHVLLKSVIKKSMRTITANKGLWTNFCPPSPIFIKFWMTSFKKSNLNKTVYLLTENVYHFDLRLLIIFQKLFFFFWKTLLKWDNFRICAKQFKCHFYFIFCFYIRSCSHNDTQ